MNDPLVLGFDLGTTNAKATAFDLQGRVVARATAAYAASHPRPGWHEQEPSDWQAAAGRVLDTVARTLGQDARRLTSLGLAAHAPGLVLLDRSGAPLGPAQTWQDERSWEHGEHLLRAVGPGWVGLGLPRTGFPAKLAWVLEHRPDVAAGARWAMGVKDFLVYWLTGEVATDPSCVAGGDHWFAPAFEHLGWPLAHLPEIRAFTAVGGRLKPALADAWGLPRDLPVVMGLSDGAASTLGTGAIRPGDSVVSVGTNAVLRTVLPAPLPAETCVARSLFAWPYVDGLFVGGGFAKSGGESLEWLARAMATTAEAGARARPEGGATARLLDDAASSPPGSAGVVFLPFLTGRGSPQADPEMRGAFVNLQIHHRQADLTRAVLEGVACALRDVAEALDVFGPPAGRLRIGGGGGQSPLWRQIVADVLGRPVAYQEGDAVLGAAMVAAVGLGLFPDIRRGVAAMVPPTPELGPVREHSARYREVYAAYCHYRDRLRPEEE